MLMPYDKRKLESPISPWLESERLHRKNMLVGSARLYNALVREHPKIVRQLQTKYNIQITEVPDVT